MLYDLIEPYNSISIIGMCKNAGKTTVLNGLIGASNGRNELIGLTSIGRDGERSDLVTNTKKPEIHVREGTLFATAEQVISLGSVSREILDVTDMSTPMGNIVLLRAMSDGFIQLAGPSMTVQLREIRNELLEFGAERVFLDGALSRKSLAMPSVSSAAILCSGASYSPDVERTAADTAYCARLMSLEKTKLDFTNAESKFLVMEAGQTVETAEFCNAVDELRRRKADALFMRGGVTDAMVRMLLSAGKFHGAVELVVEDSSRLLISKQNFDKLMLAGAHFSVITQTRLIAVTINPFSAYGKHYDKNCFYDAVRRQIPDAVEVIDILEDSEC